MIVSGWKTGASNIKTGSGYGIRIKLKDRDKYFSRNWNSLKIEIVSNSYILVWLWQVIDYN